MALKLTGWQRLWVVVSMLYFVGVIFFVYMESQIIRTSFTGSLLEKQIELVFDATLFWIVSVVMLYIFGWLVGWIVRGFKQKDAN